MNHRLRILFPVLLLLSSGVCIAQANRPGFYVDGRFLHDPCGNRVIMRGVNEMIIRWDAAGNVMSEIGKSGANTVRIMWMVGKPLSDGEGAVTKAVANGMIPMLELHDATGDWSKLGAMVDYWCSSASVAFIRKHEKNLLVNIANECGGSAVNGADFVAAYTNAVTRMRNAGIHVPIVIDADIWGRNEAQLLNSGGQLVANDPDRNLIFSWHPWDANAPRSRYDNAIAQSISENICLIIGEFAHKEVGCRCCIDYKYIMDVCQRNRIGWLAWSWGLVTNTDCAEMDMTRGGNFSTLSGWGLEVATSDPNSIKNTSLLSPFILSGACTGIRARLSVDRTSGAIPLTVNFDGSGSMGANLSYSWTFGNGATGSGAKVSHTYQSAGTFKAVLTVSSGADRSRDSVEIKVSDPAEEPPIRSVNDSETGNGLNQFEFVGNWSTATGSTAYRNDEHWSFATDAYYLLRFYGRQIMVYGTEDAHHGIAAMSIDGGPESDLDLYSSTRTTNTLFWTSPALVEGNHTVKVRVTGRKNPNSTSMVVVADRIDIYQNSGATPVSPPRLASGYATSVAGIGLRGTGPYTFTISNVRGSIVGCFNESTIHRGDRVVRDLAGGVYLFRIAGTSEQRSGTIVVGGSGRRTQR